MGYFSSLKAGSIEAIYLSEILSKSFFWIPWTIEKWMKLSIVWLAPSTMETSLAVRSF